MIAVFIGVVFIVTGAFGMLYWWQDLLSVLRGFGPFSIFIGGLISLLAGVGSAKKKDTDDGTKS